jgi:hypothetical protein
MNPDQTRSPSGFDPMRHGRLDEVDNTVKISHCQQAIRSGPGGTNVRHRCIARFCFALISAVTLLAANSPAMSATGLDASLYGVHSVRIAINNPPFDLDPLSDYLRNSGVTVERITQAAREGLEDEQYDLTVDPKAPYTLSIRVDSRPDEGSRARNRFLIWVNVRVVSWTQRDLGPYGKQRVAQVLWESQSVWSTTRRELRREVLDSIRSHVRALPSEHGKPPPSSPADER